MSNPDPSDPYYNLRIVQPIEFMFARGDGALKTIITECQKALRDPNLLAYGRIQVYTMLARAYTRFGPNALWMTEVYLDSALGAIGRLKESMRHWDHTETQITERTRPLQGQVDGVAYRIGVSDGQCRWTFIAITITDEYLASGQRAAW